MIVGICSISDAVQELNEYPYPVVYQNHGPHDPEHVNMFIFEIPESQEDWFLNVLAHAWNDVSFVVGALLSSNAALAQSGISVTIVPVCTAWSLPLDKLEIGWSWSNHNCVAARIVWDEATIEFTDVVPDDMSEELLIMREQDWDSLVASMYSMQKYATIGNVELHNSSFGMVPQWPFATSITSSDVNVPCDAFPRARTLHHTAGGNNGDVHICGSWHTIMIEQDTFDFERTDYTFTNVRPHTLNMEITTDACATHVFTRLRECQGATTRLRALDIVVPCDADGDEQAYLDMERAILAFVRPLAPQLTRLRLPYQLLHSLSHAGSWRHLRSLHVDDYAVSRHTLRLCLRAPCLDMLVVRAVYAKVDCRAMRVSRLFVLAIGSVGNLVGLPRCPVLMLGVGNVYRGTREFHVPCPALQRTRTSIVPLATDVPPCVVTRWARVHDLSIVPYQQALALYKRFRGQTPTCLPLCLEHVKNRYPSPVHEQSHAAVCHYMYMTRGAST